MNTSKIEQYIIVSAKGYDAVQDKVNELIQQGYQPQGGASMSVGLDNGQSVAYYTQAMIKIAQ
jgi:hypothetical protein